MRSNDRLGINHAPTPAGAKEPDAGKEGICEKNIRNRSQMLDGIAQRLVT